MPKLKGINLMIISKEQMNIMVEDWISIKLNINNKVEAVNWSDREDGFIVQLSEVKAS